MITTDTTISAVLDGKYAPGYVVTVTGVANGIARKACPTGPWMTFRVVDEAEGVCVKVSLLPSSFPHYARLLDPAVLPDGMLGAPRVTVTGFVEDGPVPSVVATAITASGGDENFCTICQNYFTGPVRPCQWTEAVTA